MTGNHYDSETEVSSCGEEDEVGENLEISPSLKRFANENDSGVGNKIEKKAPPKKKKRTKNLDSDATLGFCNYPITRAKVDNRTVHCPVQKCESSFQHSGQLRTHVEHYHAIDNEISCPKIGCLVRCKRMNKLLATHLKDCGKRPISYPISSSIRNYVPLEIKLPLAIIRKDCLLPIEERKQLERAAEHSQKKEYSGETCNSLKYRWTKASEDAVKILHCPVRGCVLSSESRNSIKTHVIGSHAAKLAYACKHSGCLWRKDSKNLIRKHEKNCIVEDDTGAASESNFYETGYSNLSLNCPVPLAHIRDDCRGAAPVIPSTRGKTSKWHAIENPNAIHLCGEDGCEFKFTTIYSLRIHKENKHHFVALVVATNGEVNEETVGGRMHQYEFFLAGDKCDKCEVKTFSTPKLLRAHAKQCHNDYTYEMPMARKLALYENWKGETVYTFENRQYVHCPYCKDKLLRPMVRYNVHYRCGHEGNPVTPWPEGTMTKSAELRAAWREVLVAHNGRSTSERVNEDSLPRKGKGSKIHFKAHWLSAKTWKPTKCPHCPKPLKTFDSLRCHINRAHPNSPLFTDPVPRWGEPFRLEKLKAKYEAQKEAGTAGGPILDGCVYLCSCGLYTDNLDTARTHYMVHDHLKLDHVTHAHHKMPKNDDIKYPPALMNKYERMQKDYKEKANAGEKVDYCDRCPKPKYLAAGTLRQHLRTVHGHNENGTVDRPVGPTLTSRLSLKFSASEGELQNLSGPGVELLKALQFTPPPPLATQATIDASNYIYFLIDPELADGIIRTNRFDIRAEMENFNITNQNDLKYLLLDRITSEMLEQLAPAIVYVGRGKNYRCLQHVEDAKAYSKDKDPNAKRPSNAVKAKKLREIWQRDVANEFLVGIFFDGINRDQAQVIEKVLIEYIGLADLTNVHPGAVEHDNKLERDYEAVSADDERILGLHFFQRATLTLLLKAPVRIGAETNLNQTREELYRDRRATGTLDFISLATPENLSAIKTRTCRNSFSYTSRLRPRAAKN